MFLDNRIIFNTSIRWAGEIFNKLIWFVLTVFLARMLGGEQFGHFSYAWAFGGLFAILTDLGTNTLLTREVSKNKNETNFYITYVLATKLFLSFIVFLFIFILAFVFSDVPEVVILFSLSLLISAFLDPFNSLYRAYKQMYYEALVMLIWRLLLAGLTLLGVWFFRIDILGVAYIFVFGSIVSLCLTFLIAKKIYKLEFHKISIEKCLTVIRNSFPIGVLLFLGGIFFKLNTILLQYFSSAEEVGLYSASYRLIEGCFFIPSFFVGSVFPFLCEYSKDSDTASIVIFKKSFLPLFLLAICLVLPVFFFSDKIITFLYGNEFFLATKSLKIIVWSLICIFSNELFLYLFISKNKEKLVIKIMSFSVIFYLVICIVLLPAKGFIGAAWTLLISQILLFLLYLYHFLKISRMKTINLGCGQILKVVK